MPKIAGGNINSFEVQLISVSVTYSGGETDLLTEGTEPGPVVLDSGTNTIILPTSLAHSIFDKLGAELADNGAHYAPCSLATGRMTIDFGFESITIHVPVGQILGDNIGDGTQTCQVSISPDSTGGVIILGDQVLSSMYAVYDMDNSRVLLAEAIFHTTEYYGIEHLADYGRTRWSA